MTRISTFFFCCCVLHWKGESERGEEREGGDYENAEECSSAGVLSERENKKKKRTKETVGAKFFSRWNKRVERKGRESCARLRLSLEEEEEEEEKNSVPPPRSWMIFFLFSKEKKKKKKGTLRFMMAARLAVWPFGYAMAARHGTALLSERINHNSNTKWSSPAGLYEQWKFQPRKKKKKVQKGPSSLLLLFLFFFCLFVFYCCRHCPARLFLSSSHLKKKKLIAPSSLTVLLPAFLPSSLSSLIFLNI